MSRRFKLAAASCLSGFILAGAAAAATPQPEFLERSSERFDRAIEAHLLGLRYRDALAREVASRRAEDAFDTLAGGVSQATLDAVASCESGGDPTAVNPSGYYGKYQFDRATWAAVGGRGNPAEASEAEQDYRASLLYSRAGSSPWPSCG